jgi:hypothetical protein
MYKKLLACAFAFSFFVSLSGCATPKDYKPKSKDEAEINNVLIAFDEGAGNGDVQKVAPLLHENFNGEVGRDGEILTKKEYLARLSKQATQSRFSGEPQMTIDGNKAEVQIAVSAGTKWYGKMVFHLVKENDKWLITGWKIR